MSEAPERIWAYDDDGGDYSDVSQPGTIEYIRVEVNTGSPSVAKLLEAARKMNPESPDQAGVDMLTAAAIIAVMRNTPKHNMIDTLDQIYDFIDSHKAEVFGE